MTSCWISYIIKHKRLLTEEPNQQSQTWGTYMFFSTSILYLTFLNILTWLQGRRAIVTQQMTQRRSWLSWKLAQDSLSCGCLIFFFNFMLFYWLQSLLDLGFPARDQTHAPAVEAGVLTTGLPGMSLTVILITMKLTKRVFCFIYSLHHYP